MAVERPLKRRSVHPPSDIELQLWSDFVDAPGATAKAKLFDHYLPLSRRIASRHFRVDAVNSVPTDELFQLACTGLLEAIDRFKPELGVPFRYFASRRITGSILNGIARYSEINQQISFRKRVVRERLASFKDGQPAQPSFDDALDILGSIAAGLAIGMMLDETSTSAGEDQGIAPDAYETLAWKQLTELIASELRSLPEREREIVRLHYQEGLTFEQLGTLLGLTKGRISQLHKAAIAMLRKRLLKAGTFRLKS